MYNSTGQGAFCVVLHYVFQSFYVNIQLSKNINCYILGYTAPHHLSCYLCIYTITICSCYQKYYNFFNFFLPLATNGIFYWCLTSILLLYSAILKMSILFLNFFYFFVPSFAVFTFIICTPLNFMHTF